jgi:hypothetical protein
LSDGAIAVGVPKARPEALRAQPLWGLGGIDDARAQGITLVEPDGNIRWDILLSRPTSSMVLAPGTDGSVVYSIHDANFIHVVLIDREGTVVGGWMGLRLGFHEVAASAICSDPAGDIYLGLLTGDRKTPMPTVCRLSTTDPSSEVICLGVEDVVLPVGVASPEISAMVAPEPGAVVFAIEQPDYENETAIARIVRVEFEP